MAGAPQIERASRLRIQQSPQSGEGEEGGVKSTLPGSPYWLGQRGFEGFMPLTRWSEGVPRRGGRERSHDYWAESLTPSSPLRPYVSGVERRAHRHHVMLGP